MFPRGSKGSPTPRVAAVAGMSCISPWAPRGETARGLNRDSISTIVATRFSGTSYRVATSLMWERMSTLRSVDIRSHIKDVATRYDVPENLVATIVEIESRFNPRAVSPRGAQGLMQLMPATAATLGVGDPFDPRGNIEGGVRHLRSLMDRFDNNLPLVLAAYNAGEHAVIAHRGVPPYRQTRQYVKRILRQLDRDGAKTSDTGQRGRKV